jgi:integrase
MKIEDRRVERVAKRQGSPQRIRQVFSEFYREHYGQDIQFTSVADYANQWLTAKRPEISGSSFRRYEEAVAKWLAHLGSAANRGMDEVIKTQVASFRDALLALSSPATTNHALKIVRMVFRAARREGFLFQDPAEGVRTVKSSAPSERRPFTIDELRAVLEVADDEWKGLIKFGLYTGQRLADIAALTWAQVDLSRNEIRLTTRKTGKKLVIPFADPLREHLLSLPAGEKPRSPVHPRAYEIIHTQGGRVGTLSRQFSELLAAAGLRQPLSHTSRGIGRAGRRQVFELSFHSLRHTAVSLLKDAAIPDAVVMAQPSRSDTLTSGGTRCSAPRIHSRCFSTPPSNVEALASQGCEPCETLRLFNEERDLRQTRFGYGICATKLDLVSALCYLSALICNQ